LFFRTGEPPRQTAAAEVSKSITHRSKLISNQTGSFI
jgi:hypothetical protein